MIILKNKQASNIKTFAPPPPPRKPHSAYGLWSRAMMTTALTLLKTLLKAVTPTTPNSPISSSKALRFLVTTCFALMFIAQPTTVYAQEETPLLAITTHSQTVNTESFMLTGTVPQEEPVTVVHEVRGAGGSVTKIESIAAIVTGTSWTATATLREGDNHFYAATDIGTDGDKVTQHEDIVITRDSTAPAAPVITSPTTPTTPTNNNTLTITGTAEADSTVTLTQNGNVLTSTATAGSSGNWTIDVTLSTDNNGINTFTAKATDQAGNVSGLSNLVRATLDQTKPTIQITSTATSPTNTSPIPINLTFSEPLTGFDVSDITVSGGTITTDSYTVTSGVFDGGSAPDAVFTITPSGDGLITVSIAANAAQDSATNDNLAASFDITYDGTASSVTITSTSGNTDSTVNANTLSYTATFDESVTDFELSDITVTGSANGGSPVASNLQGTGTSYTFDVVKGSSDGSVTVSIAAGVATDAAGNNNTASNNHTLTIDTTAPAVAITTPAQTVNADSLDTFGGLPVFTLIGTAEVGSTVEIFRENVSHGSAPVTGSGTWTKTVAFLEGTNEFKATATDTVGNTADATVTITRDTAAPTVAITTTAQTVNTAAFTLEGTTEAGATVTLTQNGNTVTTTATATAGGAWSIEVTLSADNNGANTFTATAMDQAGNVSGLSNLVRATLDQTKPTIQITSTATSPTNTSPIPINLTFSEPLTGFDVSDITVSGGTITTDSYTVTSGVFDGGSAPDAVFTITPSGDGLITVSIAANAAQDSATNDNLAASFDITYDGTRPGVSITSSSGSNGNTVNANTLSYTATFDESVTDFELSDITVTGSANGDSPVASNLQGTGTSYTFDVVKGSSDGSVTVSIAADAAMDAAGNNNTASNNHTLTIDTTAPAVAITTPAQTVNADSLEFHAGGLSVFTLIGTAEVGSTVEIFRENVSHGSAPVTGSGTWTKTVAFLEGTNEFKATATDTVGNTADATVTIMRDTAAPTVAITTTAQTVKDASFTLEGTTEAGATVDVLKDGTSIGAAIVSGTGWTFAVTLTDGANTFTATASDVAMNKSAPTAAVNVTLDTAAPTVAITTTAQTVNAAAFTLAGTVEAGATVDVLKGGTSIGAAIVSGTDWTFAVTLTDGANAFTATASDVAGNTSDATAAVTVTLDTAAPTITITTTPQTVNAAAFTLAGTVEAGATVDVLKDGTSIGAAIVSGTDWTFAVTLTDGANVFTATASDVAMNKSAPTAAVTVTLDTAAPTITITTTPQTVNAAAFTLAGTVEAGATVDVLKDGTSIGAAIVTGTDWTFAVTLTDGANVFTATASDVAMNKSAPTAAVTVTLDTAAPTVAITTTAQTVKDASFTLEGTTEAGATVDVLKGGTSIGAANVTGTDWTFAVTLTDGANVFTATASDVAMNKSAPTAAVTVTLDTAAPTITITTTPQTVNAAAFTLAGTVEAGATVDVLKDGTSIGAAIVSGTGWTFAVTLTDGANAFTATASDVAMNKSAPTAAVTVTLDTAAPTITITTTPQTVNAAAFTLAGTVEAGATVDVLKGGTSIGAAIVSGTGWTFAVTLTDGANTFTATASDVAMNKSAPTAAVNVTLDTAAPTITITTTTPQTVKDASLTLTGTVEAGATVDVLKGGTSIGAANVTGTDWTFAVTLTDGANVFTATASDVAGNTSDATAAVTVTLDTAAPTITITTTAQTVKDASLTLTGTVEAGSTVDVLKDGTSIGAAIVSGTGWTFAVTLTDGANTFTATASDVAMNKSAPTAAVNVTLDTAAPTVAITTTAQTVKDASFTLEGTTEAGSTVDVLKGGTSIGAAIVSGTDWTFAVTLTDGANVFTATASDVAMNKSAPTAAVNITLDTAAPTVAITTTAQTVKDASLTLTGTVEAGSTVDVLKDGTSIGAAIVSGTDWTFAVTLTDGANVFTATASDVAMNKSAPTAAVTVTLDTAAPTITITTTPQTVNAAAFTLEGTTEAGATVDVLKGGTSIGAANVTGTDWTFAVTLTDGANVFTATASDVAMNKSAPTAAVTVTLDTAAPTITITTTPQTVNAAAFTLAGTVEAGATVDVLKDGTSIGAAIVSGTDWTFAVTLTDGANVFTATASDVAMNKSAPTAAVTVTLDTAAPTITITTTPQTVNAAAFTLAGTVEAGATVDVLKDGTSIGAAIVSGTDWTFAVTLTDGANAFTATASDATGNRSDATDAVNITLDTTAPTVAITTTPQTVNTAAFTLAGTVDAGGTVDVLKDGTSIGAASVTGTRWSLAVTLDDGANTFTATATDATDNTSDATDAVIITLDTAPSFSSAAITAIANKSYTYTAGTAIPVLTLPKATGGNGALTYSLSPILPQGLTFDTTRRTISGTPEAETASTSYTYIAADSDTNTAATDTASLTFSITVLSDGLSEEDIQRLNLAIMPRLTQALVASSAASVERRVDIAFTPAAATASYQLDGHQIQFDSEKLTSGLLQKLAGYARTHKDGNINWKQLLTNSSFLIPLNSADQTGADQASAANTGLALWGSGDYTRLSENDSDLDWQGDLSSYQLGLDKRLDNLLLGGMLSWSEGDVDYTLEGDEGTYNHKMTSIHPYLAWNNARANLWGSLGYGQGDLTIEQEDNSHSTDTNLLSLAAGIKGQLIPGLSLKSDLLLARTDINAAADMNIAKQTIDSQRFRLLLEIAGQYTLASGGSIKPMLEIGARYDGDSGDSGNSGTGAVLGAGMRYANLTGLTLEGNLHALVGQGNYKEWGIQALISLDPGTDKLGLAFSLRPGYGYNGSSSDTSALWQQSLPQSNLHNSAVDYSAPDYDARLGARLSYGLLAPSLVGLLTPYSEITLGTINSYRLGIRWQGTARFDLHLFGERRESSGNLEGSRGADQAIQLEGRIHF